MAGFVKTVPAVVLPAAAVASAAFLLRRFVRFNRANRGSNGRGRLWRSRSDNSSSAATTPVTLASRQERWESFEQSIEIEKENLPPSNDPVTTADPIVIPRGAGGGVLSRRQPSPSMETELGMEHRYAPEPCLKGDRRALWTTHYR